MEDSSNQSVNTRNYVLVSHFRKTGEKIIESSICKERRRGIKLGFKRTEHFPSSKVQRV